VQKQKDLKMRKPHFPLVAPSPMQCLLHIFLNFPSQTKRKKQ